MVLTKELDGVAVHAYGEEVLFLTTGEATELLYLLDEVLSNGKNGSSYPSYGQHNAE